MGVIILLTSEIVRRNLLSLIVEAFYTVAKMPTTEAGIDYRFFRDIYVVLGDANENGSWTMRSYIKPFANWIWAGSLLMALGGLLSLSDRRFRTAPTGRKSHSVHKMRTTPAV